VLTVVDELTAQAIPVIAEKAREREEEGEASTRSASHLSQLVGPFWNKPARQRWLQAEQSLWLWPLPAVRCDRARLLRHYLRTGALAARVTIWVYSPPVWLALQPRGMHDTYSAPYHFSHTI